LKDLLSTKEILSGRRCRKGPNHKVGKFEVIPEFGAGKLIHVQSSMITIRPKAAQ